MKRFRVSRRALLASLSCYASLSADPRLLRALAQDLGNFDEELSASRDISSKLAAEVLEAEYPIGDEIAFSWRDLDFDGRLRVASAAAGLASAGAALETGQLLERALGDRRELAQTIAERGVALIPSPDEVVELSTEKAGVESECPSKVDVAWDIVLDSMDLLDEKELFKEAFRRVEGSEDAISRLESAIESADTDRIIDALFSLLDFILNNGTIYALIELAGERVAGKFLKALTLRLLPFVGTGYALTALGLALYRHWDRLFCD